jgi:hypothetical protein
VTYTTDTNKKHWPAGFQNQYDAAQRDGDWEKVTAMAKGPESKAWHDYLVSNVDSLKKTMDDKYQNYLDTYNAYVAYLSKLHHIAFNKTKVSVTNHATITIVGSGTVDYSEVSDYVWITNAGKPYDGRREVITAGVGGKYIQVMVSSGIVAEAINNCDVYYTINLRTGYNTLGAATKWDAAETAKSQWESAKKSYNDALVAAGLASSTVPVVADTIDAKKAADSVVLYKGATGTTRYNLPGVRDETYFTSDDVFEKDVLTSPKGNAPRKVDSAENLWSASYKGAHKGMIQQYQTPYFKNKIKDPAAKKATKGFTMFKNRRGFQFMYNPPAVGMSWQGTPDIDPGYMMAGMNQTTLIKSPNANASVSFGFPINRMPDMKYMHHLKGGKKETWTAAQWGKLYGQSGPLTDVQMNEDLPAIRDRGTLYDIEYLLDCLLGYKMQSAIRNNIITSDIGYLGAFPIELHLGKNMRYIGTIDDLRVTHTVFTEEMVPVYSNIEITVNRMPDFPNYDRTQRISGEVTSK